MKQQKQEASPLPAHAHTHAPSKFDYFVEASHARTHATREAEATRLRATLLSGTRAVFNLAAGAGATSRGGSACEGRAAA